MSTTTCYNCKESIITNSYKDDFCSEKCFNECTMERLFFCNIRKKHYIELKKILLEDTCICTSIGNINMKYCSNCERYICDKCCTRPCFICSLSDDKIDHGCKICLTRIKHKDTGFVILLCDNCNNEYEEGLIEF